MKRHAIIKGHKGRGSNLTPTTEGTLKCLCKINDHLKIIKDYTQKTLQGNIKLTTQRISKRKLDNIMHLLHDVVDDLYKPNPVGINCLK